MKPFILIKGMITLSLCLVFSLASAQPPGAKMSNAIPVGTLIPGDPFYDQKNTSPANGFGNDYGQPSDDVFYSIYLEDEATIEISTCDSDFDTYLSLLDGNGNLIASNDDDGPLCDNASSASMRVILQPGYYYVVAEGYSYGSGNLHISIGLGSAQTTNEEFSQKLDDIFGNLELSRVPYGLLKDIAFEQSSLESLDGTAIADSNHVSLNDWTAIYSTILSARVNNVSGPFKTLDELETARDQVIQPGKVILNGLFYRYSQFKSDALQNGQVQVVNNVVYDKYTNGNWQNPYEEKKVFAVAASASQYQGKTQNFILPASLWVTNSSGMISTIQMDPGDGAGFRTITPDQPLTVNYSTYGDKEIVFKLNQSNSITLFGHITITISPSVEEAIPGVQIIPIATTETFNGQPAYGFMTIKYANPASGLQRPLIIAEGFDTGHIINPQSTLGDNDLYRFLDNLQKTSSSDNTLNKLIVNDATRQYDLVYVDWFDGTANIKKNALVLKQVIREVNIRKANAGSTQKNVVLGLSMGGLVARWALKDMENHQETHQTRLYISYDSPHKGANVPIGYQFALRHMKDMYLRTGLTAGIIEVINYFSGNAGIRGYGRILDADASKQMLIDYVKYDFFGSHIDNSFHDNWENELKNMGYPAGDAGSPFRKVAVSNGSECATSQPTPPGGLLFGLHGKGNTSFIGDIVGQIALPIFAATSTYPQFYLGVLPGKNEMKFDIDVNSVQTETGNRVYYNKITYTKKLLWVLPITTVISDKSQYARQTSLALDSYPGGYFNTGFNPKSGEGGDILHKYNVQYQHNRIFGFVPVASSLDVTNSDNDPLVEDDYVLRYKGAAPPSYPYYIPFDNFITAANSTSSNESHTQINQRNGDWVAAELNTAPATAIDCTVRCLGDLVNGPATICQTGTYTAGNLPVGATLYWTVDGAIKIVGASNQSSVTIERTANSGSGHVVAHVTTPCDNASYAKEVTLKTINAQFIGLDQTFEAHQEYHISVNNINNLDWSFYWEITGAATYMWPTDPRNSREQSFGTLDEGWFHVKCTITDACGAKGIFEFDFYNHGPYNNFTTYPNPANSEILIEEKQSTATSKPGLQKTQASSLQSTGASALTGVRAILYNSKQQVLRSQDYKTGDTGIRLDVRDIPNGIYFLHIISTKQTDKRQIIIQH